MGKGIIARTMADLLAQAKDPTEAARIQRAIDAGRNQILYHGTHTDFPATDPSKVDLGLHVGTSEQATNRLADLYKRQDPNASRGSNKFTEGAQIMPLAVRPGKSLEMSDVGDWDDSIRTALALRSHPEMAKHRELIDELLDSVDYLRTANIAAAKNPADGAKAWINSDDNRRALQEMNALLVGEGYGSVKYLNAAENTHGTAGAILPEYVDQLSQARSAQDALRAQANERKKQAAHAAITNRETAEQLLKYPKSPLGYLMPEERELFDKYASQISDIEMDPIYRSDPNSYIILNPYDQRSINAQFDPEFDLSPDLMKAEGGLVEDLPKFGKGQLFRAIQKGAEVVGEAPLKGAPESANIPGLGRTIIGPNPKAEEVAQRYAAESGIPYEPLREYPRLNTELSERIAKEYARMPAAPDDKEVQRAYDALIQETMGQYEQMLSGGVKPYFIEGANPYAASPYLALKELYDTNRIGVFPTVEGFGSDAAFDPKNNPLLASTPYKISGRPALANDIFRAVHDYMGHAKPGVGFRAAGEEAAYQSHAGMFSPLARRALASETRGQNSWLNYGPFGEKNRSARIEDTIFADQKAGLLPRWAAEEGRASAVDRRARFQRALRDGNTGLEGALTPEGRLALQHYSDKQLDRIDPSFYGTGLSGSTRSEMNRAGDRNFMDRWYAGLETDVDPYMIEGGLGPYKHTMLIDPELMYPLRYPALDDPDRLWRTGKPTLSEKRIADQNYSGYYYNHPALGNVAVMFDPLDVKKADGGLVDLANKYGKGGIVNSIRSAAKGSRQIDTDEFNNWFGDSKAAVAVNPDTGLPATSSREPQKRIPQTLYHTTTKDFPAFTVGLPTKNSGTFGDWDTKRSAIFMTPSIADSEEYGKIGGEFLDGASVMPLHLRTEKPLDLTAGISEETEQALMDAGVGAGYIRNRMGHWDMFDGEEGQEITELLKRAGYDSVIFNDINPVTGNPFESFAVFDPANIKSAIGNVGTYDPLDPDITKKVGGLVDLSRKHNKGGLVQKYAKGDVVRQWLKGYPEKSLAPLKLRNPGAGTGDPAETIAQLQKRIAEEDPDALAIPDAFTKSIAELAPRAALNNWIDTSLAKYIKRDYGSPNDPLAALAPEQRHVPLMNENLRAAQTNAVWPPKVQGQPPSKLPHVSAYTPGYFQGPDIRHARQGSWVDQIITDNPWMASLAPDDELYENVSTEMLGLPHLRDELYNALRPDTDLPDMLRLKPESLPRVSVAQASQLVGKINAWRAANKAKADLAASMNPATFIHKEYPEQNMRWVQLRTPEELPPGWSQVKSGDYKSPEGELTSRHPSYGDLEKALKYEGDTMGHCVGGYCDSVFDGTSKIYSLRDARGEPHVTIEAEPQQFSDTFGSLQADQQALIRARAPNWASDEELAKVMMDMYPETAQIPSNIIQIKGKSNNKPIDKYLPFVQDFVKSQKWGDIGDFGNTGLRRAADAFQPYSITKARAEGIDLPDYLTEQEIADITAKLQATNKPDGMKEGGEVKDKNVLDKFLDSIRTGAAGFATQYTPDERGHIGLASSMLALPELSDLVSAGSAPEWSRIASQDYDEHLNNMLARYGLPDSQNLPAMDKYMLAAGEMLGQLPIPGKLFGAAIKQAPRLAKGVIGGVGTLLDYFGPTVAPSAAVYGIGTGIGGTLRNSGDIAGGMMSLAERYGLGSDVPIDADESDRLLASLGIESAGRKIDNAGIDRYIAESEAREAARDRIAASMYGSLPAYGRGDLVKNITKAFEQEVTAPMRANAGRAAAKQIAAQPPIKASEALGRAREQGLRKVMSTQADRTIVGRGNIGGPMFSALSLSSPEYAKYVWGVGDAGTASRLINASTPDTAWTTLLGSSTQLRTNPIVFDKLKRGFQGGMRAGLLTEDLASKINQNLVLTFGDGADIRDPSIWRQADTFEKRAALADVMLGQGRPPKKGGVALGGAKSGKGVIFDPLEILLRETEPSLRHPTDGGSVPTFAIGPRLFTLSGEKAARPDLHPAFPTLLEGRDLGMRFEPVPIDRFMPDWHLQFSEKFPSRRPGYYDYTLGLEGVGLPGQTITDQYLNNLMSEGFAMGGLVEKYGALTE